MYRNYYYKLIKKPEIQKEKLKKLRKEMARYGFRIKEREGGYLLTKKGEKEMIATKLRYQEVEKICNELKQKAESNDNSAD